VRFSKLVRGTLNASVAGEVTLQEEMEMLKNYLELEKLRFKDAFEYSITVHPSLDTMSIAFSPMLLQPYVENAIVHGMRKKKSSGRVDVLFEPKGANVFAIISDNGLGFSNFEASKLNHKSVGMTITRRRLELLHQIEGGAGLVKIEEITDGGGKVSGTRVKVLLK
jgi:LytS/YehU family sensor histidine kinase